ncbi:MAG TPA: HAD family phosphatase [Vicinamibacterales bacterium]
MRAVLWDLDGTLADSEEYHWLSWRDTLVPEGIEITYDQFLASFGQKNDRILTEWLGKGATPERIRRLGDAKELEYRRLAKERGLTPLPGAAEWIQQLKRAGWKQAIASSAPRENVEVMLAALGLATFFDAVITAEDVTAGKPDPQVFRAAAFRVHVPPSHCIVVEDAAAGIEAARRAGMRCIGVSRTTRLDADVFVSSLDELLPTAFDALLVRPIVSR